MPIAADGSAARFCPCCQRDVLFVLIIIIVVIVIAIKKFYKHDYANNNYIGLFNSVLLIVFIIPLFLWRSYITVGAVIVLL